MQRNILLLLLSFTLISCYKDSDATVIDKVERPPIVIVDGYLYGTHRPAKEGTASANSMLVNGQSRDLVNGELALTQLSRASKDGQFIEFFSGNERVGAAQVSVIENQVNYYELYTIPFFSNETLEGNIDLKENLNLNVLNASYITNDGSTHTEAVAAITSYSEDHMYNDQLITYAYGREGTRVVVDVFSSYYIGLETMGGESLEMKTGEITVKYGGDDAELYYYSEEAKSWLWVSDLLGGANTEEVSVTGYFAIGSSQEAAKLMGAVNVDGVPVAGQQVIIQGVAGEKKVRTTSEGKFQVFLAAEEDYDIRVFSGDGELLYSGKYQSAQEGVLAISLPVEEASSSFVKSDFAVLSCEGEVLDFKELKINYGVLGSDNYVLGTKDVSWLPVRKSSFNISAGGGPKMKWGLGRGEIHYLSECSDFEEGFTYVRIRDDAKMYDAFREERSGTRSALHSSGEEFSFIVEASDTGSLSMEDVNVVIDDLDFGDQGYHISCANAEQGCGIEVCEITHFRSAGDDWSRIYFSGKMWMQTIDPPQSGNFNVEGIILTKK